MFKNYRKKCSKAALASKTTTKNFGKKLEVKQIEVFIQTCKNINVLSVSLQFGQLRPSELNDNSLCLGNQMTSAAKTRSTSQCENL